MTWTLTLCIGMFMQMCGQVREVDFPDRESCERERQAQLTHLRGGYAICAPGKVRVPAERKP